MILLRRRAFPRKPSSYHLAQSKTRPLTRVNLGLLIASQYDDGHVLSIRSRKEILKAW